MSEPTNNNNTNADNEKAQEEITLSKRMFFVGCLGLPWLWVCNVLYFRLKVFGPMVMFDYWPGQKCKYISERSAANEEGGDEENEEQLFSLQERQELEKWVKRSTRGAMLVVSVFLAWVITFQVNKDNFGDRWFVMDATEEEATGW